MKSISCKKMTEEVYHIPALLNQTIEGLNIKPGGIYIDATFGGGGHSRAILDRLGKEGKLLGFDRDLDASENALDDSRFTFVHSNFRYIQNFLKYYGLKKADGILADLGVSFHHFDDAERGFSFRAEAPLDMRMDRKSKTTAADILAEYSESDIAGLLHTYTDLKKWRQIAAAIVKAREESPIETTLQLCNAVERTINPRQEKKELSQIFQALRIEVNGEMDSLKDLLATSIKSLKPGGRLAIISYHSIEDRIVKNFFKTGNFLGEEQKDFFGNVSTPWKVITRSPIVPDEEEVERNPRSRSAKLRIAQLKEG